MLKTYIIKFLFAVAVLVLPIYTLCSCGEQVFLNVQIGIDTQSNYEPNTDTQAVQEPIKINGIEYIGAETDIDMSGMLNASYDLAAEYINKLPLLKTLNTAELQLTAEQYLSLCALDPDVIITSKISFEGKLLDLNADVIDISEHKVEDKEAFSSVLSKIKKNIKLVMCDCGYTNEQMQALRDSYPALDFAWRIYMGKWSLRTDDEAFSVMIYNYNYVPLTSEDISVLKYCTNMYALDLGHQHIKDLSVLYELPELRVLILADNKITDLTPISSLKKLEYLELFVNRISDVAPLAQCENLVDLNIGWNRSVKDISSIYSLSKIERLWLPTTAVSADKRPDIEAAFPNAKIVYSDPDSISSGWRTHPRYFVMRSMFTNNKYDPEFTSYKE